MTLHYYNLLDINNIIFETHSKIKNELVCINEYKRVDNLVSQT